MVIDKLSDKTALALACISNHFIAHITFDSWGDSILIMEKRGNAFGSLYWFHDDNTTVYIAGLSVDIGIRQQGMGTKLHGILVDMGIKLGATTVCLWVKKDSWTYNWYHRLGYMYLKNHKEEGYVWMQKMLA